MQSMPFSVSQLFIRLGSCPVRKPRVGVAEQYRLTRLLLAFPLNSLDGTRRHPPFHGLDVSYNQPYRFPFVGYTNDTIYTWRMSMEDRKGLKTGTLTAVPYPGSLLGPVSNMRSLPKITATR